MKFLSFTEEFIMDIPKWQIQSFLDELASRIYKAATNGWLMLTDSHSSTQVVELEKFIVYITIDVRKK